MKIRFTFWMCCIIMFCSQYGNAQKNNKIKQHSIYAETATKGLVYSINYDRVFASGKTVSKTYHTGFSVYNNILAVAIGLHFFTGQNAHHAEFGLTVIPYVENYKKQGNTANESDKKLYIIPGAGYRYQKKEGGFFCKVIAAPVLALDPPSDNFWKMDTKVYAGVSIAAGYNF